MLEKLIILLVFLAPLHSEVIVSETNYKTYTTEKPGLIKWVGCPDANYSWDGERLKKETVYIDENGKKKTSIHYKNPIEIIADFKPETVVHGVVGNIEKNVVEKFGGALKGFIWLDKVAGGGEVVLPFTAAHIFIAKGDRLNPILSEISTDTSADNFYEIIDGKTHVYIKSFSGIGGAAGAPPTLIAHYKMNDNLATDVILDETGNNNGAVKDATGTATSAFHSVEGKINFAQDLDGTDDHIEIDDHDDFTPALTPFSINAWIYMHSAIRFPIVSKSTSGNREWILETGADSKIYWYVRDNSAAAYIGRSVSTALTGYENIWLHVVGTYDGGILSSGHKIYLNGTQSDDTDYETGTFVAVENLGADVWIGREGAVHADGLIDNVALFSEELSPDDVNILNNGRAGTEILAELDSKISSRRSNLSPMPSRRRYEF